MLRLAAGEWTCELEPAHGGMFKSLRYRGIDVLRPLPPGSLEVLESGCFPLVPFCNRIRQGRFKWQGDTISLPANFPPENHSLHGLGWQAHWQVGQATERVCTMVHDHAGLGPRPWSGDLRSWPWAYRALQEVALNERGCTLMLCVTNRSNVPMPAGIGLHPYFRRDETTKIHFKSCGMVPVGRDMIPTADYLPADHLADWSAGSTLPSQPVDNCFVGWDGLAKLTDRQGTIAVSARGAPCLHVYAPQDGKTLALEPVSHSPDALNQAPADVIALPPGCTAAITMRITAS